MAKKQIKDFHLIKSFYELKSFHILPKGREESIKIVHDNHTKHYKMEFKICIHARHKIKPKADLEKSSSGK